MSAKDRERRAAKAEKKMERRNVTMFPSKGSIQGSRFRERKGERI